MDFSLDDTDRRLLKALQDDGRMSNADLAKHCHLSPAACHDRVRRLRDRGVIIGYAAILNPSKVERSLLIFVEVRLEHTTRADFDAFAEAVARVPEILECHMVAGGFDYLVKARVKDMQAYRAFLGDVIVALPGVRETRTYAVLEEVKHTNALPL